VVPSRTILINLTFLQCGFGHDHHPARLFRSSAGAPHSSPGFLLGSLWHKRELRQLKAFATAVGSSTKKGTLFGPILEESFTRFCTASTPDGSPPSPRSPRRPSRRKSCGSYSSTRFAPCLTQPAVGFLFDAYRHRDITYQS
jgi:hypothetical protein